MRLLAWASALFAVCAFVLAPYTVQVSVRAESVPPFPYHRYSEVPGVVPTGGKICGDLAEDIQSTEYRIISGKDRDIFLHKGPGDEADYVYFAKGTSVEGVIHVIHAYTVEEAKAAYPAGPCSYFTEVEA